MQQRPFVLLPFIALVGAAACGEAGDSGPTWAITATGVEDRCTGATPSAREEFEYQVSYDTNEIVVSIGKDRVASGLADGCRLHYETLIWTEERNGFEVTWQMRGEAVAQYEGTGCNLPDGTDWLGTESFEIIHSADPALAPGCTYVMELRGEYLGGVP